MTTIRSAFLNPSDLGAQSAESAPSTTASTAPGDPAWRPAAAITANE
jgi:hypothetical protein